MTASSQFDERLAEWLAQFPNPSGADPVTATVARAKQEIIYDINAGTVPRSVKSFAELHDFVDANG